jgi:hypothetical protein
VELAICTDTTVDRLAGVLSFGDVNVKPSLESRNSFATLRVSDHMNACAGHE